MLAPKTNQKHIHHKSVALNTKELRQLLFDRFLILGGQLASQCYCQHSLFLLAKIKIHALKKGLTQMEAGYSSLMRQHQITN